MKVTMIRKLLCVVACLMGICTAFSKQFSPTTKWPYLFENFQEALIYKESGEMARIQKANLHLEYSSLHYIDGENVITANTSGILKIEMGGLTFIYMNGELVQLLLSKNACALVKRVKIDQRVLRSSSGQGAYGMSTDVSATKKLRSLQTNGVFNMNYAQMKVEREDGVAVNLVTDYFFLLEDGKTIIKATKRNVEKKLSHAGKARLKAFVKQNKIKWKNEDSLKRLLNFFQQ